ncbi:uncharacterized protein LOC130975720 [Arachis stenosperma]|uniref:uncharacterized protein LOC130975720 n=1 Tax=Arachis stenosperma TaxID=217475 RepID=UPI0025ACFE97|nr:uncharacterized protein LOC130975720 [Arachis stenosperma]
MGEFDRWSDIHQDLFNEINKRFYSYNNYIQLRLVCKQWNLKLPKIPEGNKVPWLVLSTGSAVKESFEEEAHALEEEVRAPEDEGILDARSLEEKRIYHLMLPVMQDNIMCGSRHGWLIIVMGLIITRNTIFVHQDQIWKAIINSTPNNDNDSDFIAVVIYGLFLELAFYMPNEKRWIRFPTRDLVDIHDVIFFEEKIFAVDGNGQLYEFDTRTKSGPVGGKHEATPPPSNVGMPNCYYYLIGGDNRSLLMLVKGVRHRYYMKNQKRFCKCETVKFDVYELKKNEKTWSRIHSLGNYILVIGSNSSVQILPSNFLNCRGNQIYFTDDMHDRREVYFENTTPASQIGIFDLEDGSCQTFLTDVDSFCHPIWILP